MAFLNGFLQQARPTLACSPVLEEETFEVIEGPPPMAGAAADEVEQVLAAREEEEADELLLLLEESPRGAQQGARRGWGGGDGGVAGTEARAPMESASEPVPTPPWSRIAVVAAPRQAVLAWMLEWGTPAFKSQVPPPPPTPLISLCQHSHVASPLPLAQGTANPAGSAPILQHGLRGKPEALTASMRTGDGMPMGVPLTPSYAVPFECIDDPLTCNCGWSHWRFDQLRAWRLSLACCSRRGVPGAAWRWPRSAVDTSRESAQPFRQHSRSAFSNPITDSCVVLPTQRAAKAEVARRRLDKKKAEAAGIAKARAKVVLKHGSVFPSSGAPLECVGCGPRELPRNF